MPRSGFTVGTSPARSKKQECRGARNQPGPQKNRIVHTVVVPSSGVGPKLCWRAPPILASFRKNQNRGGRLSESCWACMKCETAVSEGNKRASVRARFAGLTEAWFLV